MKKKLFALALTLAIALTSAVPAAAAFTTVWRLEDAGMTVALPSDWEVLTPDMDADDIAYTTLSTDFYAGVLEWITDDEICIYALEPDSLLSLIIFADDDENGVDYRTASDGFMKTLVEGYNEGEYERLRNYNAYIREVEGLRYIWSEYTSSANDDYFLLTELVLNGVYYYARIDSLEPITDNDRDLMCSVLESTSYDAISYSGRYLDPETGCVFTAPEGWTVKENENAWNGKSRVTLVSPSQEMSVYFGSEPVEGETMADFTPADIESAFALSSQSCTGTVMCGGTEFFELTGGDIRTLVHITGSRAYIFKLDGAGAPGETAAVADMLAYAQFPGDTVETSPEPTPEITEAPASEHPEVTGAIDPGPEGPNIALIVSGAVLVAALIAVAITVVVRRARRRREDEADTVYRANDIRFCHICGARIDPSGGRYCTKCGAILPNRTDRSRGGFPDDL